MTCESPIAEIKPKGIEGVAGGATRVLNGLTPPLLAPKSALPISPVRGNDKG